MRDIIGILLSGLCVAHCLGLAFLLPLLSGLELGFNEELIHWALLGIVTLYTAFYLWPYASKSNRIIAVLGLVVLLTAMSFHGSIWESVFTIAGSLSLMTAHFRDLKSMRKESLLAQQKS